MHKAFPLWDDIDECMCQEKNGGRGLTSIQDSVDASIQRLEDYKKALRKSDYNNQKQ